MEFPDLKKRIGLSSTEDTRFLHCDIKTLNLLPAVMAAQKAQEEGCQECVFHRGEVVTECSHSNISILKDGVLRTHPLDRYILPGIARKHLLMAAVRRNIPIDERPFTMDELRQADEVLVTSSSKLCLVAGQLEGRRWAAGAGTGGGPPGGSAGRAVPLRGAPLNQARNRGCAGGRPDEKAVFLEDGLFPWAGVWYNTGAGRARLGSGALLA